MSSHNKKAQGMSMIVKITAILLSAFFIVTIQQGAFKAADDALEGENCRIALGLQKTADKIPLVNFQNNCETIITDLPIKKRKIKTTNDTSRDIAKRIARTWDIVHKGSIANMWKDESGLASNWAAFSGDKNCFVMYDINLEYFPDEGYYTQEDLWEYLDQSHHKNVDGLAKTYHQYIQNSGESGVLSFPEREGVIDENENGKIEGEEKTPITNKVLMKKTNYAISIASSQHEFFKYLMGDSQSPTVLSFSSLEYAEDILGCVRR